MRSLGNEVVKRVTGADQHGGKIVAQAQTDCGQDGAEVEGPLIVCVAMEIPYVRPCGNQPLAKSAATFSARVRNA